MASKSTRRSLLPAFLLLALLLLAFGRVEKAEARLCSSPSKKFIGLCFSDRNCANVCHNEGFPGGDCQGFRRRCMCQTPCPSEH
ncbi:defensin Tk-AMP-D5-like isoform X2 [Nymphaea colorata]|nr:defensin Tk-AMP-D5-like isoform X2 [Nymphaea colorata]